MQLLRLRVLLLILVFGLLLLFLVRLLVFEGFQKLSEIKKHLTERLTLRQAALLEVIAHALENNQKPVLIENERKTLETFDPLVKEILEGYIQ